MANVIREPHLSYVLELFDALGELGHAFVLAGAQAMKFAVPGARATHDFDFVLDVVAIQDADVRVSETLNALDYTVVPGSEFFHFEKSIAGTDDVMRIEFMAPDEGKDPVRVKIQKGLHARACLGGSMALLAADRQIIDGTLPDGRAITLSIAVARPRALVLLKLLAMDDRNRNVRGPKHREHDHLEATIHTADVVAILSATDDPVSFAREFWAQFDGESDLEQRVRDIIATYFESTTAPGILLYEEFLARTQQGLNSRDREVELDRARRLLLSLAALPMTRNLLVSQYQIACALEPANPATLIALTFEESPGSRSSTHFEPASPQDMLAYAAVLRLSRPRWFDEHSKALMTSEMDVSAELADPQQLQEVVAVREFECRWQQGEGGWVLLRLADYRRFLYRFEPDQGARFCAALAALKTTPVWFMPSVEILRGVTESDPGSLWGRI